MLAARDQEKTMVPRAHNTLDGHPEVKHGKSYTDLSNLWLIITQSHKPHPTQLMRLVVKPLPYDTWSTHRSLASRLHGRRETFLSSHAA